MTAGGIRARVRRGYRWILEHTASEIPPAHLSRSAVVFSPHFDDETLGCGGTLIRKVQAGARVRIVFMTDGSRSHAGLISAEELRSIRAKEGRAAARTLGLDPETDVHLLGIEETTLSRHEAEVTERLAVHLGRWAPQEVYVPYRREPWVGSDDHVATRRAVLAAVRRAGLRPSVFEYPVWTWHHWPWVPLQGKRPVERAAAAVRSGISALRLLRDFRCYVDVREVLERKREALAEHRSQMSRLRSGEDWPVLSDVAGGDFLRQFFDGRELFYSVGDP